MKKSKANKMGKKVEEEPEIDNAEEDEKENEEKADEEDMDTDSDDGVSVGENDNEDDDEDDNDDDDDDDEDDYFSNADAASYWSAWSEENVHVMGLVDNDVVKRTRALKKLRAFLKTRSADEENPFEEKDLLKIWKGLHYSMWHSDKLLVQQELAGTLADLIFCFETTSSAILFVQCFLATIVREWDGIDAHRLNKFMTLIRRVWRASLLFLKKHKWETQLVSEMLQTFRETMIRPNSPSANGLAFHMIDIYVDELTKVGGVDGGKDGAPKPTALSEDAVFDFLRPYVVFCSKEKSPTLRAAAIRDVFDALVGQVEDDFLDDLGEEGFEMHGKIDNQKLEGPLDKGAGIEDTPGTRLAVDFGRVGGYILKVAGGKKVNAKNRQALYKVAATYENLSKGIYPWEEIEVEEKEGRKKDGGMTKAEIAKAVKRLEKENERKEDPEEKRKRKKRKLKEEEGEGVEESGNNQKDDDDDNDAVDNDDDDDDAPIPKKKPLHAKKSKKATKDAKSSKQNNSQKKKQLVKKPKTSKLSEGKKKSGLKIQSQSGAWSVS